MLRSNLGIYRIGWPCEERSKISSRAGKDAAWREGSQHVSLENSTALYICHHLFGIRIELLYCIEMCVVNFSCAAGTEEFLEGLGAVLWRTVPLWFGLGCLVSEMRAQTLNATQP